MARYDVYRGRAGLLFLDCQADALSHLTTRVVVPLLPADQVPPSLTRLHPRFEVEAAGYVMATHLLTAISTRELVERATSLARHDHEIMNALDALLTGI